jgi:hypothetical protein
MGLMSRRRGRGKQKPQSAAQKGKNLQALTEKFKGEIIEVVSPLKVTAEDTRQQVGISLKEFWRSLLILPTLLNTFVEILSKLGIVALKAPSALILLRDVANLMERRAKARLQPPKHAAYLLYIFLPKKDRDPLLGDLEEDYHRLLKEFGPRRARTFYYTQVAWSIGPIIWRAIKKIAKWGVFGAIAQFVARLIS